MVVSGVCVFRPVLAALVVLCAFGGVSSSDYSDVIRLTDDNFDDLVGDGPWLIKIYAPWCSHCRRVEGVWEEVATRLKKHQIKVGNIDGTKEKVLMNRFELQGFPSFFHLVAGECREYSGQRTVDDFVSFATHGWEKVEPLPFYKAPNSPVGRILGKFQALPDQMRHYYKWLHSEKGMSDLSILTLLLSIPVVFGLGLICLLDIYNSRHRDMPRPHAD
ncbi:hypothetical protein BSKO_09845 [Bryopsis sp. KO-2023]|nr:hypothetical protein BSKO_09845 [Bryopsis sp. KO-2023]